MRVGVVSDSHRDKYRLLQFIELAKKEKFDCIVHCGDVVDDANALKAALETPVYSVRGNCDMFADAPKEIQMSFDNIKTLILHGDRWQVKNGLTNLSYHADESGARLTLFGHTHRPFAGFVGSSVMVNPGALENGCYAVVTLERGDILPRLHSLDETI